MLGKRVDYGDWFNTLDSYGESGCSGFIEEGITPSTTDSSYTRHIIGGSHNVKETDNEQKTNGVVSDS